MNFSCIQSTIYLVIVDNTWPTLIVHILNIHIFVTFADIELNWIKDPREGKFEINFFKRGGLYFGWTDPIFPPSKVIIKSSLSSCGFVVLLITVNLLSVQPCFSRLSHRIKTLSLSHRY